MSGEKIVVRYNRPNLTGTWKLNTEKSDTGGQNVQDLIVKIEHKDPMFRYTAAGSAEGNNFEESAELSIGGKETTASNGLLVSARWEGNVMVATFHSADDSFSGIARHSLSEDGKTITRDAVIKTPEGENKQHMILEKQ